MNLLDFIYAAPDLGAAFYFSFLTLYNGRKQQTKLLEVERMAITEKIQLLGKNYYQSHGISIPAELTLQAIPTSSELEFVTSENFDDTMIESILPQAVKEKIDFNSLLEEDYNWLLRCLRILNYGPYFTANRIICPKCGVQYGEFQCDLRMIDCIDLPADFNNKFVIKRDEFLDFNGDIEFKLLTIREALLAYKDTAFKRPNGLINRQLSRVCYRITSISGQTRMSPIDVRLKLDKEMSSADWMILKEKMNEIANYGLRAGGKCTCPKCSSKEGTFIALVDDKFFRPTLGDLRSWKNDRDRRRDENSAGDKAEDVREHNGRGGVHSKSVGRSTNSGMGSRPTNIRP